VLEFNLKVRAQELVDVYTKVGKGSVETTERLKLTLQGQQGDKKTKFTLICDPEFRKEYALKKVVRVRLDIPQTELDLDAKTNGAAEAALRSARGRRGASTKAPQVSA